MARLVVLGDSLALGSQSFAVSRTEQSFPGFVAHCMGLLPGEFLSPDFEALGGLPFNIEWAARTLQEEYGTEISAFQWPKAAYRLYEMIDQVRAYWQSGAGAQPGPDVLYHNLSFWAAQVGDALNLTSQICLHEKDKRPDDLMHWPFFALLRNAQCVLNPAASVDRQSDSLLDAANRLKQRDGVIDHLLVSLGVNNCSRSVIELSILETPDTDVPLLSGYTLWTRTAFERDYLALGRRLAQLGATHTYLATIPHVTSAPIIRGLMTNAGELPAGQRYFDTYVHLIHGTESFNPLLHAHLTGEQCSYIDRRVDDYNDIIRHEADRHGWEIVDLCRLFDTLAIPPRVSGGPGLPPALADLTTAAFTIENGKLKTGGLMSLDGFHPTACGSALVAQEFIHAIRKHEPNIQDVDFAAVRQSDTLVSNPPATLSDMMGLLSTLEEKLGISRMVTRFASLS